MPKGKTTTKQCEICNRDISLFAYNRHVKSHANDKHKVKNNESGYCKFCSKLFNTQNGLHNHETRCKDNPDRKIQKLTEDGRNRIIKKNKESVWDENRRKKHSESMRRAVLNNPDSYTASNVCGRTKIIEFNGDKFHGKWEVEVAKWLTNNHIKYERDVQPFNYFWNEKYHLYFPDFYIPSLDKYIEVKGYETERDRCKWSAVENLVVLKQKEIKQIQENTFTCL